MSTAPPGPRRHACGWSSASDGATRAGRQHPGVLRAAALRAVDDQLALGERDPGEPARQHPHALAVVHRERAQVDVPRPQALLDERRDGRQLDDRLRDPPARVRRSRSRSAVELGGVGLRADDEPLAARAVDRLDDELVQPVEDLLERVRLLEPPGVDVPRSTAPRRGSSG